MSKAAKPGQAFFLRVFCSGELFSRITKTRFPVVLKAWSTPEADSIPSTLKHDPLEPILVIFGRSFLHFLFERFWKNMKNDTTFVRMRSSDHLRDAKMSKKGTSLRRI